ncbi:MAG: hypothetical protein QOK29_703, partial [Rhodospirillaceae bacterium]|nr:hypothetical protein [Rhodospirillaceae bacterium]
RAKFGQASNQNIARITTASPRPWLFRNAAVTIKTTLGGNVIELNL